MRLRGALLALSVVIAGAPSPRPAGLAAVLPVHRVDAPPVVARAARRDPPLHGTGIFVSGVITPRSRPMSAVASLKVEAGG